VKTKIMIIALSLLMLTAGSAWAAEPETPATSDEGKTAVASEETPPPETVSEPSHGFGHKLLFYIPNRILDVFDFMRLRVRVGPGFAVGVRATKLLSAFVGGYSSIYAGLPGPRLAPVVKWPIGLENYAGVGVSLADATAGGNFGPNYSNTEFEVSVHPLIIGFDIGVDPVEVLDLALGFLFIDIRGDDL